MTLFGARKAAGGEIRVDGKARRIRKPADAIKLRMGIALVPEDRKTEGLMLPMSVRDNLTLAVLGRVAVLRDPEPGERARARAAGGPAAPDPHRAGRPCRRSGTLSGGNQQKVLIGRWLLAQSDVLLLYDITRGVDVGTKHDIYELMMELVAEGKSLLFYSSETEEMARLCHRVLVMREGRIAAELAGEGTDAETIVAASLRRNRRDDASRPVPPYRSRSRFAALHDPVGAAPPRPDHPGRDGRAVHRPVLPPALALPGHLRVDVGREHLDAARLRRSRARASSSSRAGSTSRSAG